MSAIPAAEIVRLWERGTTLPPVSRALALLESAQSAAPETDLAALTIGERDGRLLALRESMFGASLGSVAQCPHCETSVEFSLDAPTLRSSQRQEQEHPQNLVADAISLQFRLLDSRDLAAVASCLDVESARRRLAERCIVEAKRDGIAIAVADISEAAIEELSKRLGEADPQADIALDLHCPACGESWWATFDVASFVWTEISVRARQLLGEVHALAWAYGWDEADILAMSDVRRHFYLGAVQ